MSYVHLNLGNIEAEMHDIERNLLLSGEDSSVQRIKELLADKPYYMPSETERVLADHHGIENMIVVATAHDDFYVLERETERRGKNLHVSKGLVGAWLYDLPLIRKTRWELVDEPNSYGSLDFRPIRSTEFLDRVYVREWLSRFPYQGGYCLSLLPRWRPVANYHSLTVYPGFHEAYIDLRDFKHYIEPLYPPDLHGPAQLNGRISGIQSVEEAFEIAARLRESLHRGDVACEPEVHIADYTDLSNRGGVTPVRWMGGKDTERNTEVLDRARYLKATRDQVEGIREKLSDERITGERRRWLQSELDGWEEELFSAQTEFLALCPDKVCEEIMALDDELRRIPQGDKV